MARAPKVPRTHQRAPKNTKDDAPAPLPPPPTSTSATSASTTESTAKAKAKATPAQILETALNWLHTVDDWSVAGYQNKLPRWVYAVAVLIIIDVI